MASLRSRTRPEPRKPGSALAWSVIQNQKHLLARVLDQRRQELDRFVAVEGLINDSRNRS